MAFYDSLMQPWALRNVLDTFSGALPGTGYSYDHPLYDARSGAMVSQHGFSFHHDMGNWPTSDPPGTDPVFDDYMGQEQLQNWILSAGLYWSRSADHAWLTNNLALLQTCLNSMLLRDDTNAATRNGITKNINRPEGTTFDNLDASLQAAGYSGRLAVRNWASYLALGAMFGETRRRGRRGDLSGHGGGGGANHCRTVEQLPRDAGLHSRPAGREQPVRDHSDG